MLIERSRNVHRQVTASGRWLQASARSWPQAASMARPLVLRTVTLTPGLAERRHEPADRLGLRPLEGQARHRVIRDQVDMRLAPWSSRARAWASWSRSLMPRRSTYS